MEGRWESDGVGSDECVEGDIAVIGILE